MDGEVTADGLGRLLFLGGNLHLLLRVVLEKESEKAIDVTGHEEAFRVLGRRVIRLDHFLKEPFDGMALGVGKDEIVVPHRRALQNRPHRGSADLDPYVGPRVVLVGAIRGV